MRERPTFCHRDFRRSNRGPRHIATFKIRRVQRTIAVPWPLHAALATRMTQLYRGNGAITQSKLCHLGMRRDLTIAPKARTSMSNTSGFLYRCCFRKDDASPSYGKPT